MKTIKHWRTRGNRYELKVFLEEDGTYSYSELTNIKGMLLPDVTARGVNYGSLETVMISVNNLLRCYNGFGGPNFIEVTT